MSKDIFDIDDCCSDSTFLDEILCGGVGNIAVPDIHSTHGQMPNKKLKAAQAEPSPSHVLSSNNPLTTTVLHAGKPVVVEDAMQFRKTIQTMVTATMMSNMKTEDEYDDFIENASMIEIATYNGMMKAVKGDVKAMIYFHDRILGKPVNQTKNVNCNITYEELLNGMDADEHIESERKFVVSS